MDGVSTRSRHFLLARAKRYDRPVPAEGIAGHHYDFFAGLWINETDGSAYVDSRERRPPQSKKNDIETGEDQKGE